MNFTTLFFDLDDTLYPNTSGLWSAIRARMGEFMFERLGLAREIIPDLRRDYFKTYGSTLRGLQTHYQVDPDEYLAYVHDLPLDQYLVSDPRTAELLASLPQPKWIFTNADAYHARRVLEKLNLQPFFQGIVDVRAIEFACKPEQKAYQRALALAGSPDPCRCVFLDDSADNLAPAREMGFFTILVGSDQPNPAASRSIPGLLHLPRLVPELWQGAQN